MMTTKTLDAHNSPRPITSILLENDSGEFRIPLEYLCPECGGAMNKFTEGTKTTYEHVPCDRCNNRGAVLTAQGQRILEFVKRWSK